MLGCCFYSGPGGNDLRAAVFNNSDSSIMKQRLLMNSSDYSSFFKVLVGQQEN